MRTINSISNIALHYAREPQNPYGTRGRPHSFQIDNTFYQELTACFDELFSLCPLGQAEIITTAGIYVPKENSFHTVGKAIDLDAFFWDDYNLVTSNFMHDVELYLGIESILRKHFGVVLAYFYNNDHKNHIHIDNSMKVPFKETQRSKILYIQLVLTYIYNTTVLIDGAWGDQTSGALNDVLSRLNITGNITTKKVWLEFLSKTSELCFALFDQNKNPRRLLNEVYDVVLDMELNEGKKQKILAALNSFKNNAETGTWLDSFTDGVDVDSLIQNIV